MKATLVSCLILSSLILSEGIADEPVDPPDIEIRLNVPYRDGNPAWRLDLAMKKERGDKSRPGILIVHGGGWIEGDKSSFSSKKHGVPGNIVEFAELGFVAVTINYRMSKEAPFPAALEDCKAAVRWLRAHAKEYNLDKEHIGAYGNSAGGHLALMLGMTDKAAGLEGDGPHQEESSMVQAAVSDSGPLDLKTQYESGALRGIVNQFLGGPPEGDRLKLYRQASPSERISRNTPPLLLIYGVSDGQVPVETADAFVAALGKAKLDDVSYHRLAYVDHCPHSLIRVPAMKTAVNEFFLRTLMHPETAKKIKRRE